MKPTIDVHIIILLFEYTCFLLTLGKSNEIIYILYMYIWVGRRAYNMLYKFEQSFNIFFYMLVAEKKEEKKEYVFGYTIRF